MVIKKQGSGPYYEYAVSGTTLAFGGADGLSINCAERQADQSVRIDICVADGKLQEGAAGAESYAAAVVIPARRYETVESGTDVTGNPAYARTAQDLDMDAVALTLWTNPDEEAA